MKGLFKNLHVALINSLTLLQCTLRNEGDFTQGQVHCIRVVLSWVQFLLLVSDFLNIKA